MTFDPTQCAAYGAAISFVVTYLKRIGFVRNNPKIVAFVFTWIMPALIVAWNAAHAGGTGPSIWPDWSIVAKCVAAQFAAAVTVHETVTSPIAKVVALG